MKSLAIGFVLALGLAAYTAWKQLQGDAPKWHIPAASLLWGIFWFTPLTMLVMSAFERAEPEQPQMPAPRGWAGWVGSVAGLLLLFVFFKFMGSLIDGTDVCRSWDDDGRFCRSALFLASPFLLAVISFLFAWFYERRPASRPVLKYALAAVVGIAAGAAICLVWGEWNVQIVAVATLIGPVLWLNRRFLFPAMLLELFDRKPDSP